MKMPISDYQEDIVRAVNNNDVTIITAETGSGKSTQIPQYLAEHYDSVVVTEPRVMAAITLAHRVAEERDLPVGDNYVGYCTGYEKHYCRDGKITYVTDGLQLIRMIFSEKKDERRVLILDEVHEWNLNIEVLVAWCKRMMNEWTTKVVIMSATMDTMELASFFNNCKTAVISISGHTYNVEMEEKNKSSFISSIKQNIEMGKNILVFVPGKREIAETMHELENENAVVLPLHGELNWIQQSKCFEEYDCSKVIVATNVAQTSITISDIDVVIDSGEAKLSIAEDGIQGLFLKEISKADILQRKGRAGRTKEGKYILCSGVSYNERQEYTLPEIQRSILSKVVLQLAAIEIDAEDIEFFHQPSIDSIKLAKKNLIAIGAMNDKCQITPLGREISKIPLDVNLARMIVEAKKYGVVLPVITIATIVQMGGLLFRGNDYSNYSEERNSDLLAELDVWRKLEKLGHIDFDKEGISAKNYFRIKKHIQKLTSVLEDVIKLEDGRNYNNREYILKACLTGYIHDIYIESYLDKWVGADEIGRQIDRNSCTCYRSCSYPAIVGIPKIVEFKSKWGTLERIQLLSFVTLLSKKMIIELVPNQIMTETLYEYDPAEDAICIITQKTFRGLILEKVSEYDYDNPRYVELRDKYRKVNFDWQDTVEIGGVEYKVYYNAITKTAHTYIDLQTLNSMTEESVYLENGMIVYLRYEGDEAKTVSELKKLIELSRIRKFRNTITYKIESLSANTLKKVLENREYIGAIDLNCGHGEPDYIYSGLVLKRDTVFFTLFNVSDELTKEALQFLFMKEVKNLYHPNRFSHLGGKKKKKLTPDEEKAREEFFDFAKDLARELTLDNCEESLQMLEEFYTEIMAA